MRQDQIMQQLADGAQIAELRLPHKLSDLKKPFADCLTKAIQALKEQNTKIQKSWRVAGFGPELFEANTLAEHPLRAELGWNSNAKRENASAAV